MDQNKDNLNIYQQPIDQVEQQINLQVDGHVAPPVQQLEGETHPPIKHPRSKSKKTNLFLNIFCILSLVASLIFMIQLSNDASGGEQKDLMEIFRHANVKYLLLSLCIIVGMMTLDCLKYFVIMRATLGKRARLATAIKTSFLGKYYDNITPFATGGQPMQVYYLHSKKYSGGESFAITFIKFGFQITIWLAICLCLMVFNRDAFLTYVTDQTQRDLYTVAGWLGFGVNCLIPFTILSFAFFPKLAEIIAKGLFWVGAKLKIIKDKDYLLSRVKRSTKDFVKAFVSMTKKPFHTIVLTLVCTAEQLLCMALPYFVIVAFAGDALQPSWDLMFAIMTLYVYVTMSVTVVPTPGNSGALENAFILTLTTIASEVLFWSVFGWRFLSYYSYIIIGLVITIVDMVRRTRKARKEKALQNQL